MKEEELQSTVVKAINMALGGKNEMLSALEENIAMVLALEDEASMESIDAKLEELQQELLERANAGQDYENLADEMIPTASTLQKCRMFSFESKK